MDLKFFTVSFEVSGPSLNSVPVLMTSVMGHPVTDYFDTPVPTVFLGSDVFSVRVERLSSLKIVTRFGDTIPGNFSTPRLGVGPYSSFRFVLKLCF